MISSSCGYWNLTVISTPIKLILKTVFVNTLPESVEDNKWKLFTFSLEHLRIGFFSLNICYCISSDFSIFQI